MTGKALNGCVSTAIDLPYVDSIQYNTAALPLLPSLKMIFFFCPLPSLIFHADRLITEIPAHV